jgi:ATP-binding cassette subfamily B protein
VKANIYDYIESLPNGFETIVSALPNISIGQKQLLIIARMMLKDSKIVILDEATSNIDTETERKIQNSIELITKNKTVVTIAHRLSTIRNCDKIFFLEQGKVVEEGTHEQLLSKNGEYANLYKEQFK